MVLQVPVNHTFRHLNQKLRSLTGGQNCQLMVQYSIPPSPTAFIGDVFQVFKNSQEILHLHVEDEDFQGKLQNYC